MKLPKSIPMYFSRDVLLPLAVALVAVILIDATTNRMDTDAFKWDWMQYRSLAEDGFAANPLVSPFAYRWGTPFIARAVHEITGASIEGSFRALAYAGALLQLLGVYLFVLWVAASRKSAWAAMLAVLFALAHVKLLLYDVYRAEHFAYAFVLMGTWFAYRRQLMPLLVAAAIGVQFREFALVPLVAYVLALLAQREWKPFARAAAATAAVLALAVGLPRLLIPVTGHGEYLYMTGDGWLAPLTVLLNFKRDVNILYNIAMYTAPVLLLTAALGRSVLREAMAEIPAFEKRYLAAYSALVLLLTLYGGSDLMRFVSYLFVPVLTVFGLMARKSPVGLLILVLVAVFILNLMWIPIPASNLHEYSNFLRLIGYDDWVTRKTLYRFVELCLFTGAAWAAGKYLPERA